MFTYSPTSFLCVCFTKIVSFTNRRWWQLHLKQVYWRHFSNSRCPVHFCVTFWSFSHFKLFHYYYICHNDLWSVIFDATIIIILELHEPPPYNTAAAAAKSLQSCPTSCDPTDSSPPGSSVPGILQARTLEWVAISFSNDRMHAKSPQSSPTLCDPMDSSPPGSSIHRILQARILEWAAISFSNKQQKPGMFWCSID